MTHTIRAVREVIAPTTVMEGAGVRLRRSIAPSRTNPYDPFLLFDHFAFNDPQEGSLPGFPTHPHRGIETVTYMLEGSVHHRDSLGNAGLIGAGDVQWMTAGRGILHEEMPRRGPNGQIYGFQLWVNLPAARKMDEPRYQEVRAANIPLAQQGEARVRVVAGLVNGVRGPVTEIAANPLYLDVHLPAGASFRQALPSGHTLLVYLYQGQATFGGDADGPGQAVTANSMILFGEGDELLVQAAPADAAAAAPTGDAPSSDPLESDGRLDDVRLDDVRFMVMAGAPFGEPVVPYGPFVMNTQAEIQQALADLRNGTFVR